MDIKEYDVYNMYSIECKGQAVGQAVLVKYGVYALFRCRNWDNKYYIFTPNGVNDIEARDNIAALALSSTALYVGYYAIPSFIDVFDASTLQLIKTIPTPAGHSAINSLALSSTALYVGYETYPGIVDVLNPNTLQLISTFKAPNEYHNVVTSLALSDTALYVGYFASPGVVDVLNPSTLKIINTFKAPRGHNSVRALAITNTALYVGYGMYPGIIDVVNPNTLQVVGTFKAPPGHNSVRALAPSDKALYVGYQTSPGIIDAVNPSDLKLISTFTAPYRHDNAVSLALSNTALFVGYGTKPGVIDVIDLDLFKLDNATNAVKCCGGFIQYINGFLMFYDADGNLVNKREYGDQIMFGDQIMLIGAYDDRAVGYSPNNLYLVDRDLNVEDIRINGLRSAVFSDYLYLLISHGGARYDLLSMPISWVQNMAAGGLGLIVGRKINDAVVF